MFIKRVLCVLVVLVATLGANAAPQSKPGSNSIWPGGKTVIPWLEVNVPRKPLAEWAHCPRPTEGAARFRPRGTVLDYCIDGLVIWGEVTDVAVVSTKPSRVLAVYPELMRRKPKHLSIIGGLKTYILAGTCREDTRPYDFADPVGWRRIAAASQQIGEITRRNIVVLECETAWEAFQEGEEQINYEKLARSLVPLRETGIEFWWNPIRIKRNTRRFGDRNEQTSRLVRTIAKAVPNSVFLTTYTAWHGWALNRRSEVSLRGQMIDLVSLPRMQERLFVTVDGRVGRRRAFTPAEALKIISEWPGEKVNIYPTGSLWVAVAEEFRKELIRGAPRGR